MANRAEPDRREAAAWRAHALSQLRYFRSLSLRQKLEAVEGMADVLRHFERMRATGKFRPASSSRSGSGSD